MRHYVIATVKSWNIENFKKLKERFAEESFVLIDRKEDLTYERLQEIRPEYVFFPHWSWIIPQKLFDSFNCVVFHMADLPFGRGGSPLQNLLVRGIYDTKISAIKVTAGLDAGPVYFKEPLDMSAGNADDILRRASDIVFDRMIPRFLQEKVEACAQTGEPVIFQRRTPDQSEIPPGLSPRQTYDYIRMLDGEGYPPAYQRYADKIVYYRNARLEDNVVYADAQFGGMDA